MLLLFAFALPRVPRFFMRSFFFAPPLASAAGGAITGGGPGGATGAGASPGVAASTGAAAGAFFEAAFLAAAFLDFIDAIRLLSAGLFLGFIASSSRSPFKLSIVEADLSDKKEPIYIIRLFFSVGLACLTLGF